MMAQIYGTEVKLEIRNSGEGNKIRKLGKYARTFCTCSHLRYVIVPDGPRQPTAVRKNLVQMRILRDPRTGGWY
eukprot:2801513-Rhodomonas_salina.2